MSRGAPKLAAVLLLAALLAGTASAAPGVFVVRQNAQGDAQVVTVDPATGGIRDRSPLTWNFLNPLVETTVDPVNGLGYVITFSQPNEVCHLYTLDGRNGLQVVEQWNPDADASFFDLQYNPSQSALYGISVVSRYGRTLSNFTLSPGNVTIEHLVQMPMDWYVNASSFDPATSRYFALLNMFPTLPNTTLAQKIVSADFSAPPVPPAPSSATIFDIGSAAGTVVWHYVGWNAAEGALYGLATAPSQLQPALDTTWVTTIDLGTGDVELLYPVESFESGPTFPGPLVINPDSGAMFAFVQSIPTGVWSFVRLGGQNGYTQVARFDAQWAFRAATWADW